MKLGAKQKAPPHNPEVAWPSSQDLFRAKAFFIVTHVRWLKPTAKDITLIFCYFHSKRYPLPSASADGPS